MGDFRSTPPVSQTDRLRDFISTRSLHDIIFLPKSDGMSGNSALVHGILDAYGLWPGCLFPVRDCLVVWPLASWKIDSVRGIVRHVRHDGGT